MLGSMMGVQKTKASKLSELYEMLKEMLMAINRSQMQTQIQRPPNKYSKLSQKRKKVAARERKRKDGVSTK